MVQLGDNGGQGGHSKEQFRNLSILERYLAQTDMLPSNEASEVDTCPRNDSATPPVVAFTGGEEIMHLGSENLSSHVPNQICKNKY